MQVSDNRSTIIGNRDGVASALSAGVFKSAAEAEGIFLGMDGSDPLSLAAPGTAIAVGMAPERRAMNMMVPHILLDRENVLVVTDFERRLFNATSGARADIGPVFLIDWAAADGAGQVTASWNPVGREWLGRSRRDARLQIESVVSVVAAHAGLTRVEQKLLEDFTCVLVELPAYVSGAEGRMDFIPSHWPWMDASLPLLHDALGLFMSKLDILEERTFVLAKKERDRGRTAKWLSGRGERFAALRQVPSARLMAMARRMISALSFSVSDEAMRDRLSGNSFAWHHLRGHPNTSAIYREAARLEEERGSRKRLPCYDRRDLKPMTVYISHSADNAVAQAIATDIFLQSAALVGKQFAPSMPFAQGQAMGPHGLVLVVDADLPGGHIPEIGDISDLPSGAALGLLLCGAELQPILDRYYGGIEPHTCLERSMAVLVDFELPSGQQAASLLSSQFRDGMPEWVERTSRMIFLGKASSRKSGLEGPVCLETRPAWIMEECAVGLYHDGSGPKPVSSMSMRDLESPPLS